jgi:hypothetical protein
MANKSYLLAILGLILSGCGGDRAKKPLIPDNISCVHPLKKEDIPSDAGGEYLKNWEETSRGSGLYKPRQWALITLAGDEYYGCYVPPANHDSRSTKHVLKP